MLTITVTGGNLFDVASRMLADAELWSTIAVASSIKDPWLQGVTTLNVPSATTQIGAELGGG
jgi:hypothetical protein